MVEMRPQIIAHLGAEGAAELFPALSLDAFELDLGASLYDGPPRYLGERFSPLMMALFLVSGEDNKHPFLVRMERDQLLGKLREPFFEQFASYVGEWGVFSEYPVSLEAFEKICFGRYVSKEFGEDSPVNVDPRSCGICELCKSTRRGLVVRVTACSGVLSNAVEFFGWVVFRILGFENQGKPQDLEVKHSFFPSQG